MSTKKIFGIIFSVLSLGLIIWTVTRITSFAGQLYSWSPPFEKYEIVTIIVGVVGLILLILGLIFIFSKEKNEPSYSSQPQMPGQSQHEATNVKISAQQVSEASRDAIEVSKSFISDPIGGLANAYSKLGESKSLSVGILFIILTIILFFLGFILKNSNFLGSVLPILLMLAIVFASLSASRVMFNGKGTISSDIFITGLSLLPFSFLILISSLVEVSFGWSFFAYISFGLTYTILILFSGFTKIYQFSESKSSIFIAIILFLVLNAINIVFKIMYS